MRQPFGADQADRLHAMLLRRAWGAPTNRMGRPAEAAHPGSQTINGTSEYRAAEAAAQRACEFAQRRATHLDHVARLLTAAGQGDAARRAAITAAGLREVVS